MGAYGYKWKGQVNNILLGTGGYTLCQQMMLRLLDAMSVAEYKCMQEQLKKTKQKQQTHMLKILFQEQETCVLSYHSAVA